MKILKFVILKKLYINLILLAFIFPSLGEGGGGLYAQDPELFEHTWYLKKVAIDEEEIYLADYTDYIATTVFNEVNNLIYVYLCDFDNFEATTNFIGNEFTLSQIELHPFFGDCELSDEDHLLIQYAYFSIYLEQFDTPKNPFTYTIETIDDYYQLTLENGEGDWAVYNSVLLSTPTFHPNNFTLYPNPVKEVLQVNNSSNQSVSSIIYDINGKKLQTQSLEINLSTIYVKALNPGLYFVVFESGTGERVSKKFLKN